MAARLHIQEIEADGAGLRALGANPVADRLLGVLGHQPLELDLGPLMLEEGGAGGAEHASELSPGIGGAHIDDPDGFYARSGRLDTEEARGLAALHAAPELLLSGQQQVLVEAVGRDGELDPFAAAGDDREDRQLGIGDPHVVLQLGHMLFGRPLFGERPWQHEFGLKNRPSGLDHAVQGGGHPAHYGMPHAALDPGQSLPGIAFVPKAVEGLGGEAKLDDEVAGEVLRLDLAPFLPPQAE